ncbi:hypothetical protein [Streptomyces sp. NPDC059909]|uniref:hypothetical protein n=1 Tax=Streptomyces sp. NPDC059909 TaxID=3346998 RepID=UPI003651CBB7
MRHVRAIAVLGIALITLTGARGSRGGGCDDNHSSGSSSGGSGIGGSHSGHDDDDDLDIGTSGGSASGGSDVTDAPTYAGPTGPVDAAMGEVEIKYCSIDPAAVNVRGQLLINNRTAVDQTYDITVHFQGDDPNVPLVAKIDDVTVAAGQWYDREASAPYTGSGKGTDFRDCKVVSATRTPKLS